MTNKGRLMRNLRQEPEYFELVNLLRCQINSRKECDQEWAERESESETVNEEVT
jgi:hypothetical protein